MATTGEVSGDSSAHRAHEVGKREGMFPDELMSSVVVEIVGSTILVVNSDDDLLSELEVVVHHDGLDPVRILAFSHNSLQKREKKNRQVGENASLNTNQGVRQILPCCQRAEVH